MCWAIGLGCTGEEVINLVPDYNLRRGHVCHIKMVYCKTLWISWREATLTMRGNLGRIWLKKK